MLHPRKCVKWLYNHGLYGYETIVVMLPLWLRTIVVIMVMYHNHCGYVTSMECVMHVELTAYIKIYSVANHHRK